MVLRLKIDGMYRFLVVHCVQFTLGDNLRCVIWRWQRLVPRSKLSHSAPSSASDYWPRLALFGAINLDILINANAKRFR